MLRFRKLDMTQPEQRQALVDTFINAIYLYDDKVLITFNYKEGTETVAFGEAVKAEKSSDMSARGALNFERQIVRFGVLSFFLYAGKRLHTFCTPFAHLPESGLFCARFAQPAFLCIKMELVGARPLYLLSKTVLSLKSPTGAFIAALRSANANLSGRGLSICCRRPFCRLKAPLGLSLLRFAPQTRSCRGEAPPSCCARPFSRLKAPLGLSLLRFAAQTRTCQGEALPSCLRQDRSVA